MSIRIDELHSISSNVLSYDMSSNGLINNPINGWANKSTQRCVRVYFEDSTYIDCTPDHEFMCDDNQWYAAKTLVNKLVRKGLVQPAVNIQHELVQCGAINYLQYSKQCALYRLLGYIITDGTVAAQPTCQLYLGHRLDVNNVINDIELLCGIRPNQYMQNNCYIIAVPVVVLSLLAPLCGSQPLLVGKRVNQPSMWPAAVIDPNCPLPLLREFIAGLFGGDGSAPVLKLHGGKRDLLSSIEFSQSKQYQHIDSLLHSMTQLQRMLARLGIHNTSIQPLKLPSRSKRNNTKLPVYRAVLHINVSDTLLYHSIIGYRYCVHKSMRLQAAASFYQYRAAVQQQTIAVVNHTAELMSPTPQQYLAGIGANEYFTEQSNHMPYGLGCDRESLPVMRLRVVAIQPIGSKPVYDIEVLNTHNFLANGAVVHNCMISHGAANFLREKTFDLSDKYRTHICDLCGLIAIANLRKQIFECRSCKNTTQISQIYIPYACKLLFQELMAMQIAPRMFTSSTPYKQ